MYASCRLVSRPPSPYSKLRMSSALSLAEVEYEDGALAVGGANLVAPAVPTHLENAT